MALSSVKASEVPKNSVRLSKSKAAKFQMNIMERLLPPEDRFFVTYGPRLCAFASGISVIHIDYLYRKCVNLGIQSRGHTLVHCIALPVLANYVCQTLAVRDNIIVKKWACSTCHHIRSSLFQITYGVIYPVCVSAITAFSLARRYKHYEVPPLNNIPQITKFFMEKTKPFSRLVIIYTVLHFLLGITLSEMETIENNNFNRNFMVYVDEYEKRENKQFIF